ncbi:hornerin [Lucilia cuprina]|uniref:hornerin n=1 Tax=Lucilia cuprina TaxID=7375 RepID=UPI001F066E31|nr:hornerin [Lucilia cuprina]
MKIFCCCLLAAVFSVALADVKHVKESAVEKKVEALASDKSSDSKPKRDASHVSGVYHGPSYKYLPPSSISSSYDTYSGSVGSGGHISGVGGGYSSGGFGHNHHGFSSSGHHSSGASHGLGYTPSASYHGSGNHGLGFTSSSHYTGHGSALHSGGFKGGVSSHKGVSFGHNDFASRPHSYAAGHGYSSSGSSSTGVGYKLHTHSLGGAQEHIYVISSGPSGFGNSHGSASGGHEVPTGSYLPPVQQHPLPSSSYGVPFATVGDSYNTKYHSQISSVKDHGPAYAAGHKGLGHFSFAANKPQVLHTSITGSNKPQVLHTSITGSSFNQPSYSKAPFKPSEFLGAKFEGSAYNEAPGQQYLPPSGVGTDTTGYDYPIPPGSSINFQEPSYQQTVEVQTTSVHEPESSYLPPNNHEGSFNEISSAASGNYLPPSNTYGVPYSH